MTSPSQICWKKLLYLCSVAVCVSAQCPIPDELSHGYLCFDNSSYEEGDVLEYCCQDNYFLSGNSSIICTNQVWQSNNPQCVDNGISVAFYIITLLSVVGALVLACNITLIVFFIVLCIRRRRRNKKIDWYLQLLKESENNLEETCEYSDPQTFLGKPDLTFNKVPNDAFGSSISKNTRFQANINTSAVKPSNQQHLISPESLL